MFYHQKSWIVVKLVYPLNLPASSSLHRNSGARNPVFVGRLEGGGEGEGTNTTSDGLPSTSAVHWLPSNPGLISVTQSDGWIGIYNLNAGVLGDATTPTRVLRNSSRRNTRSRLGSNKVAEAFAELEIDLHDSAQKCEVDLLNQSIGDTHQNDMVRDVTAASAQLSHQLPQVSHPLCFSVHVRPFGLREAHQYQWMTDVKCPLSDFFHSLCHE